MLTDRAPEVALPAFSELREDLKIEPLSLESLAHVMALGPAIALVDAAENAPQAWTVAGELHRRSPRTPVLVIVERSALERYPWQEVADEFLFPAAPAAEIGLRLAMARRRSGAGDGSVVRIGPVAIDIDTYVVTASGRSLDLTFKEFELLRFLAERPGRVFTRPTLLREVWGYDFYGGTRTVDVHIRRLRAKLGPEHEHLIETVRGVGYRIADPG